jgi:hypothetical protein
MSTGKVTGLALVLWHCSLVSYCSNATNSHTISNGWIMSFLTPGLQQLLLLTHPVFRWTPFCTAFLPPQGDPKSLAIWLYQEWALVSQILWDHSFATVAPEGHPLGHVITICGVPYPYLQSSYRRQYPQPHPGACFFGILPTLFSLFCPISALMMTPQPLLSWFILQVPHLSQNIQERVGNFIQLVILQSN